MTSSKMLSIRPLTEELQQIAIEELNENLDTIYDDVNEVREWVKTQENIRAKTDDQTLVTLLRGCKYDLELAKQKIYIMCTMRSTIPEFYHNRDPFHPEIQELLSLGISLPLRNTTSPGAPRVIFNQPAKIDPYRIKPENALKYLLMLGDILLNEDDSFNVAGSHTLGDFKNATVQHMKLANMGFIKKVYKLYYEAYAVIPKGTYAINVPKFVEVVYNMFKIFMIPEHRKLVHIYGDSNPPQLYEDIPLSILPEELGGTNGTLQELTDYWKEKVESYKDWFLEEEQYRLKTKPLLKRKSSIFEIKWLWN